MTDLTTHGGYTWPEFCKRVGELFRNAKYDTLDIARNLRANEAVVYRALHEDREMRRQECAR